MLLWTWRCGYLFNLVFLFPLDIFPEIKLLDHMLVLLLIFWGSSRRFSTVAVPIYNTTNSVQVFLFFHIHVSICYLLSFCCITFNHYISLGSSRLGMLLRLSFFFFFFDDFESLGSIGQLSYRMSFHLDLWDVNLMIRQDL